MPNDSDRRATLAAVAAGSLCVAACIASAAAFLPHQSLWNDETTQLCGLSLDPVEVTRWLAGWSRHDEFDQPTDRMPPLSYWVGWLWARVFGLREVALRWLGVTCVAMATAVVFVTARRAWGLAAGTAAGLLLATSPNVTVAAVEVRAYPLFLLASAGVFHGFVRDLGRGPHGPRTGRGWLGVVSACGIAAMYLHFFGLVLCGGVFVALGWRAWRRGESPRPIVLAGLPVALAALGLVPFVRASMAFSQSVPQTPAEKAYDLIKVVYRVVGHPTLATDRLAQAAALIGAGLAGLAGLSLKRTSAPPACPIALAIVAGLAAVSVVKLATGTLDAANASYNLWILPGATLLFGSGLAARAPGFRRMTGLGVLLMLAGNLHGVTELARRGDAFAHTPARHLIALVRQLGPGRVTVLHDDLPTAAILYYPLRYEFGAGFRQYFASPAADRLMLRHLDRQPDDRPLSGDYLLAVATVRQGAEDLADQLRHGIRPLARETGPLDRALEASGQWALAEHRVYLSFYKCDTRLFHKSPVPAPVPATP